MTSEPAIGAGAPVTRLHPPHLFDMSVLGYAQISVAEPGRLAFLSGQVAGAPGADLPPELASQADIVATNLKTTLESLGASASDVVFIRLYVVNATPDRWQLALTPLRATFAAGQPSVTAIGVQSLSSPLYQLEVEMVVRVP